MADGSIVVGIDLGTTNSCAAYYVDKRVKVLENKEGGRITPSYVFFMESNAVIVGQYAKRMADAKPEYGVYEIKRLIGRKYDDPHVTNNINYFTFNVKNVSNEPVVLVENKNQIIKKTPQDLSACILKKIKIDIESKLGHPVTKAVITVPAYFNITQREATLAAAKQAGFTVLKLLNEPTAAALSYYFENSSGDDVNYSLVYDLGGGTFDVAILKRRRNKIDIICVDGDTHLGGHDFDKLIVDYACEYLDKNYSYNPRPDRRAMRRLMNESEEAKKTLSTAEETAIVLDAFLDGKKDTVEIPLTRARFEELALKLFQRTIDVMDKCLITSKLSKRDIKEVILSGGSTRIPKIQAMVSAYFDGKTLNKFVNPDECVAEGAALQAAMLSTNQSQAVENVVTIRDVTPLSLGIDDFVNQMAFLIPRNTPIPTTKTVNRVNVYDQQTDITFEVFEGERLNSEMNHLLGRLEISGITPAPPAMCVVKVSMTIDQNGILMLKATEILSGKTKDLKIGYARGQRSDNEVRSALKDAEVNKAEDERFLKFAHLKGYLIKYCIRAAYNFENNVGRLGGTAKEAYDRCQEVLKITKDLNEVGEEEMVRQLTKEVVAKCDPFVKMYDFEMMP